MNNRFLSWLVIFGGVIVSVLFWLFSDVYGMWSLTASVPLVFLTSYALDFLNWGILVGFYAWKKWRGVFAGFIFSIWWGVVSLPHTINMAGFLPDEPALSNAFDTLLWRALPFLHAWGKAGSFLMYVFLTSLMLIICSRILFPNEFMKMVKSKF